jgi:hypothetical protein
MAPTPSKSDIAALYTPLFVMAGLPLFVMAGLNPAIHVFLE